MMMIPMTTTDDVDDADHVAEDATNDANGDLTAC